MTFLCIPSGYSYIFLSYDSAEGIWHPILAYTSCPWDDSCPCYPEGRRVKGRQGEGKGKGLEKEELGCSTFITLHATSPFLSLSGMWPSILHVPLRSYSPDCSIKDAVSQALESLGVSLNPRLLIHLGMLCNLFKPQFPHLKMGPITMHTSQGCGDQMMQCLSSVWYAIHVRH